MLNVAQTKDSMTVDVAYKANGQAADGSAVTANFNVRYWWKRRNPNASFVQRPNIDGLGFFTTSGMENEATLRSGSIDRLDLDRGPIQFKLVGFPADYVDLATNAIKAWELALGAGTIQVTNATDDDQVGNPDSIVVRWYPELPDAVEFAGLTYDAGDPETGERAASGVLINGSPISMYQKIYDGTQASYRDFLSKLNPTVPSAGNIAASIHAATSSLQLGGLSMSRSALMMDDQEVLPFLPDDSVPFDTYIKGYYYDVIIHEVGHVMGLRHNFRASLITDADGNASSVMAYA